MENIEKVRDKFTRGGGYKSPFGDDNRPAIEKDGAARGTHGSPCGAATVTTAVVAQTIPAARALPR